MSYWFLANTLYLFVEHFNEYTHTLDTHTDAKKNDAGNDETF